MRQHVIEPFEQRRLLSAGSIDISFGNKGTILGHAVIPDRTDLSALTVTDAVAAPSQRTIVVGTALQHFKQVAFVARFDSHGNLDRSFGKHGIAVTRSASDEPAAAIDSAGRILVTLNGSSWFGPTLGVFSVARFTSAGSLDPTFGNKGIALANYPNLKTVTRAIAIGSDRKIVLAGSVHDYDPATGDSTSTTRFAAVRFTGSGQVDTSFHHNGMQTVDITDKGADEANAVALADNGGIVLGGFVANGAKSRDFALVRLRADGTRDHSFSKNGILAIDFGTGGDDRLDAMLLSSDGKVAVAGISQQVLADRIYADAFTAVARLTPDGEPDPTFSGDGRNTSREWFAKPSDGITVTDPVLFSATPAGNYHIIVGGSFDDQLTLAGDLKSSSLLQIPQPGTAVALLPHADGGYELAIADASNVLQDSTVPLSLEQIDRQGKRDPHFNSFKRQLLLPDDIASQTISAQGKLLVAARWRGNALGDQNGNLYYRFTPSGKLDSSFAKDGRAEFEDSSGAKAYNPPNLLPFGDGRVLTYFGYLQNDEEPYAAEFDRINLVGSLDSDYPGEPGQLQQNSGLDRPPQIVRDFVSAQYTFIGYDPTTGDTSAQLQGSVFIPPAPATKPPTLWAPANFASSHGYTNLLYAYHSRVVLYKTLKDGSVQLARFNRNGTLDKTFGHNGVVVVHLPVRGELNVIVTPGDDLVVTTLNRSGQMANWSATRILGS